MKHWFAVAVMAGSATTFGAHAAPEQPQPVDIATARASLNGRWEGQKSHDPINACQTMERFLGSEYNRENGRWTETLFIDGRLANRPSCPRE